MKRLSRKFGQDRMAKFVKKRAPMAEGSDTSGDGDVGGSRRLRIWPARSAAAAACPQVAGIKRCSFTRIRGIAPGLSHATNNEKAQMN